MQPLINNLELNKKVKYFSNLNIPTSIIKSKEAVLVYFVYESPINEMIRNTMDLFIQTHLKFNDEIIIYIFTNQKIQHYDYAQNRVNVIFIDSLDDKIMENRTIFIYSMMQLFNKFNKLYFFDSDVIPLRPYNNLIDSKVDIGLSYHPGYLKEMKYPINGGFLVINNKNANKINNFIKVYLNSYIHILNNEKLIKEKYQIKNSLRVWYGDQLLFLLLGIKFPKLKKNFFKVDIDTEKFSVRLFNEYRYNNNAIELKRAIKEKEISNKFDLNSYFQEYYVNYKINFIHLKGERRLFANDLAKLLI